MNVFNRLKSNSNASLKPRTPSPTEEFGPVTHEPKLTPGTFSPVAVAPLNEEQEAKVVKLKEYIESIMLPESDAYYPSERGFVTDCTVKRYMRARKWDYEVKKKKKKDLKIVLKLVSFSKQKPCWKILLNGDEVIVLMNLTLNTLSQR